MKHFPPKGTYAHERLSEVKIDAVHNVFEYSDPKLDPHIRTSHPYVVANGKDWIDIYFPDGYGGLETYEDAEGKIHPYVVRRPRNPKGDAKYINPSGAAIRPMIHPNVHDKLLHNKPIDTLVVTEGYFKGAAGDLHGLDIISISGLRPTTAQSYHLHPTILRILKACKVKNILLLHDADARELKWDPRTEPDKDLAHRFNHFHSAVARYREATKGMDLDVYWGHIQEGLPKGLDDLYVQIEGDGQSPIIVSVDLYKLAQAEEYFNIYPMSSLSARDLRRMFFLYKIRGVPMDFYDAFQFVIGTQPFRFGKVVFQWDDEDNTLRKVRHEDVDQYARIGCEYFKTQLKPTPQGGEEKILAAWKKTTIVDDYVKKGFPQFIDQIPRYEGFCNVPGHQHFEPVINGWYNLYYPLPHVPERGEWPVTKRFLEHIFGDQLEIGLDYITLLYRKPTQILPVLCLVSKEKGTGKSTFGKWLKRVFGNNATFINNEDLHDPINAHYATKLLIIVEEGFIEKRITKERIKSMSTAESIQYRTMYKGKQEVGFVGKFIINSNDEEFFLRVEEGDVRWWVRKVPIVPAKEYNPNLLDKMEEEIPAVLDYLKHRSMKHPEARHRAWFEPKLLETDALRKLIRANRSYLAKDLDELISNLFIELQVRILEIPLGDIHTMIQASGGKYRMSEIRERIKREYNISASTPKKFKAYFKQVMDGGYSREYKIKTGRVFSFKIEDFVSRHTLQKWQWYKDCKDEGPTKFTGNVESMK